MRKGRYAILIDGSNLYATTKELRIQVDYRTLLKAFNGELYRAYYFTAVVEDQESPLIQLLDWIEYNGWTVIKKFAKVFTNNTTGQTKIKGNMDMEIAVHALRVASHVEDIYLFSGDGDFQILVEELQRLGVRVTVVSSIETRPPMCADNLRRQADKFLDLRQFHTPVEERGKPSRFNRFTNRG